MKMMKMTPPAPTSHDKNSEFLGSALASFVKYVPTDGSSNFIKSFNGRRISTKKPTRGDGA